MAARVQQFKLGKNISTPIIIKTNVIQGSGSVTSAKFITFILGYDSNDFKLVSVLLLILFLYIIDRKIKRICISTLNAIQLYNNIDARWIVFTLPKLKIYTHWFQRNRFFKQFKRSYCSFYTIYIDFYDIDVNCYARNVNATAQPCRPVVPRRVWRLWRLILRKSQTTSICVRTVLLASVSKWNQFFNLNLQFILTR